MNQSNKDTDDILDAIKSMMSNNQLNNDQKLPKDVIELKEYLWDGISTSGLFYSSLNFTTLFLIVILLVFKILHVENIFLFHLITTFLYFLS